MIVADQAEAISFLASSHTHGGADVERIDTHTAVVFLAGARAYKLKRAVRFDYLDFSTLERRRQFCHAEVQLNRRTAPTVYTGVVPVTRQTNGSLQLGGTGSVIEWVIEMRRFEQEQLFDSLAAANRLEVDLMASLGTAIARFHSTAATRRDQGGYQGMAWVVEGNAAGFAEFRNDGIDPVLSARVSTETRSELERRHRLLDQRRDDGLVRQCHGDLHLRNIVLIDGQPTLFDGVEFNDQISCIDVMYDIAFLLMDLWHRRLHRHANVVLNRYLVDSADVGGLQLLPLFLSCRAAIRAKTSATAAELQVNSRCRRELVETAGDYLAMASSFLHLDGPTLVAIGGFSGSGKTTVAAQIAPNVGVAPGAVVLRSDEIRKQLLGVQRLERLGPDGYTESVSQRVYAALVERARQVLRTGHSVVVDAVHAHAAQREAMERVASDESARFAGCWLTAPEAVLVERVQRRRDDVSDATAEVIHDQVRQRIDPDAWHLVDAEGPPHAVVQRCAEFLSSTGAAVNRQKKSNRN